MANPAPVDHGRIAASGATIWQNEGPRGCPDDNGTLQRAYRDSETGEWGNTTSFGRDDLLTVAKVADAAHTRICELQTLDRVAKEKRGEAAAPPADVGAEPEVEQDSATVESVSDHGTFPGPAPAHAASGASEGTRLKAKAKARATEHAR